MSAKFEAHVKESEFVAEETTVIEEPEAEAEEPEAEEPKSATGKPSDADVKTAKKLIADYASALDAVTAQRDGELAAASTLESAGQSDLAETVRAAVSAKYGDLQSMALAAVGVSIDRIAWAERVAAYSDPVSALDLALAELDAELLEAARQAYANVVNALHASLDRVGFDGKANELIYALDHETGFSARIKYSRRSGSGAVGGSGKAGVTAFALAHYGVHTAPYTYDGKDWTMEVAGDLATYYVSWIDAQGVEQYNAQYAQDGDVSVSQAVTNALHWLRGSTPYDPKTKTGTRYSIGEVWKGKNSRPYASVQGGEEHVAAFRAYLESQTDENAQRVRDTA